MQCIHYNSIVCKGILVPYCTIYEKSFVTAATSISYTVVNDASTMETYHNTGHLCVQATKQQCAISDGSLSKVGIQGRCLYIGCKHQVQVTAAVNATIVYLPITEIFQECKKHLLYSDGDLCKHGDGSDIHNANRQWLIAWCDQPPVFRNSLPAKRVEYQYCGAL